MARGIIAPTVGAATKASWGAAVTDVVNTAIQLVLAASSIADLSAVPAGAVTPLQDTGLGTVAVVVPNSTAQYEICVQANMMSTAAATYAQLRILNGGAAAPTAASPVITLDNVFCTEANKAGYPLPVRTFWTPGAANTYNLGVFYVRASGSGNVWPAQAAGGQRFLKIERIA